MMRAAPYVPAVPTARRDEPEKAARRGPSA